VRKEGAAIGRRQHQPPTGTQDAQRGPDELNHLWIGEMLDQMCAKDAIDTGGGRRCKIIKDILADDGQALGLSSGTALGVGIHPQRVHALRQKQRHKITIAAR
jgi:hypothetical protein